jgi:glycosyltransferase involved in cell wall biosynthesis
MRAPVTGHADRLRILMLGWEFPPFISGGLGTACHGLTRALDAAGHHVLFVLPKPTPGDVTSHVELLSPDAPHADGPASPGEGEPEVVTRVSHREVIERRLESFTRTRFVDVPSGMGYASPYGEGSPSSSAVEGIEEHALRELAALRASGVEITDEILASVGVDPKAAAGWAQRASDDYGGDVIQDAQRYAAMALAMCRRKRFDVIHAHDWMTYPAGMALARATGRPLVAHIHSTEFDRSGEHVNQRIYDIERRGMHAATRVIAVSYLTRKICMSKYGVSGDRIEVVYNGVEWGGYEPRPELSISPKEKIVLFLGRITMQKGPEYFVASAKRVLEKIPNVKFVVAGSGDMARRMIEQAAALGIGHKMLFTGFLRGADVKRVFRMADCYVMPSVSEPFGIAPLEAISHDVPVIISKQSGVAEILTHALKVDFWDIDEMANKIVAVLRYPPLAQTLRRHGALEVRGLTWDGAANRCAQVYHNAIHEFDEPMRVFAAR